jgi:hypothetical protein
VADVSGLVILLAIGVVLDIIRKARERQGRRIELPPPRPRPPVVALPTELPDPHMRDDWRRVLEQAGPFGRRPDRALESDEEIEEEGESLEVEPTVRSLEEVRAPYERPVVDLDDASVLAVARRLREVEARDRPHTIADHRRFDERVRQAAAAPPPASRVPTRAAMREAFKWREILGRPVGWRDD